MRRSGLLLISRLVWSFASTAAHAEDRLGIEEFKSLAEELSHKVNLFKDVWTVDPEAEFYGGTSRDYLYWLKRQFRGATTRAQIDATFSVRFHDFPTRNQVVTGLSPRDR